MQVDDRISFPNFRTTDIKGKEWMQQIEAYLTELINKPKVIEAEKLPWSE